MCVVRGEMEWTRTCTVGGRQEAQLSPSDRAMRLVSSSTYTTSPDQIDGMKLEVQLDAMCHKQTDDGRVVYITCIPTTCCGEIF